MFRQVPSSFVVLIYHLVFILYYMTKIKKNYKKIKKNLKKSSTAFDNIIRQSYVTLRNNSYVTQHKFYCVKYGLFDITILM